MGVDFGDELRQLGHEVRLFEYRRDNPLYKNRRTKAAYQLWILRRLERVCSAPSGPTSCWSSRADRSRPASCGAMKARRDVVFVNFFPDNPLWMIPFEASRPTTCSSPRSATRCAASRPSACATCTTCRCTACPTLHHPVSPTPAQAEHFGAPISFVGSRYAYRERFVRELADYPLRVWGARLGRRRMIRPSAPGGRAAGVRVRQAAACTRPRRCR